MQYQAPFDLLELYIENHGLSSAVLGRVTLHVKVFQIMKVYGMIDST